MSDPEKPKFEHNPSTGIRAEGEQDRPETLKAAREAFIKNIDDFLIKMSATKDEGKNR